MRAGGYQFSARRLVQPDLFVVPARADRYRKRMIYQSESVGEYWIIDAGQRLIERWRPGDVEPEIVTKTLEWTPRNGVEPLVLSVTEYFDEIAR